MTDSATAGEHLLAGRYQVGELLGRGGMADVHLGVDTRLGRKVAVKLLKPSLANDPAFRTRFRQEAQAAARMAHPTIVRIFDAGEETTRDAAGNELQVPFIILEHVEGRLLQDVIANGPLEPAAAVRVVDGILTALEYSHRAGVVHSDIKPGNVMVTPAGQVKVMDFGIARAISESSATIAQTSAILGTTQYFSPEQARGEAIDARTDLYSAGIVLYELFTGRPPFHGGTAVEVAFRHVSETVADPNTVNAALSPALNAVVMHALAKDRSERFQTAAEFRHDLDAALSGKVPDRPSTADVNEILFGVNPNSTTASEATLFGLADEDDRQPPTQSRPPVALIWGGIALLVTIIVAAGFWVFSLAPQQLVGAGASIEVHDVVGLTYENGALLLLDDGLEVRRVDQADDEAPVGEILSMTPEPGTRVGPDFEVVLTVSSGPLPVSLPSLVFKSEAEAKTAIEAAGLVYGATNITYSPNIAAGVVTGVQLEGSPDVISGAAQVPKGSTVNLVVSNGLVNVPAVTGSTVQQAQGLLAGSTLQLTVKLEPDPGCNGGLVAAQSLLGEVPQKSTITLDYCAGELLPAGPD